MARAKEEKTILETTLGELLAEEDLASWLEACSISEIKDLRALGSNLTAGIDGLISRLGGGRPGPKPALPLSDIPGGERAAAAETAGKQTHGGGGTRQRPLPPPRTTAPSTAPQGSAREKIAAVLGEAGEAGLRVGEIVERTGVDKPSVSTVLKMMVADGEITKDGQARATTYFAP